jgi:hypothetical protein
MSGTETVTLSDGRKIEIRKPKAGELRGVKLLDVVQFELSAIGQVVPRVSELSELEFANLDACDAIAISEALVGFLQPRPMMETEAAPSPVATLKARGR